MSHIRINCPLCEWHYEPPPVTASVNSLASVFGPGVMQAVAITQRMSETERRLQEHLSKHTLVEWVTKVARLQAELDKLKETFPP